MRHWVMSGAILALLTSGCSTGQKTGETANNEQTTEDIVVDRFADVQVLRYDIEGFDKLSLKQKKLVYYLAQAGLAGRDILWDQNNPHNLTIRHAIEKILTDYKGDRDGDDWKKFETYAKQVFFANGIHHHYGNEKFNPSFEKAYFQKLLSEVNHSVSNEVLEIMFNPSVAASKKVREGNDVITASANGFYGKGVTQAMVEAFYANIKDADPERPIEHGLNSTLILKDGKVYEDVWKVGGKYGTALKECVKWLELAKGVAENPKQEKAIAKLIEYFQTGDLKTWDDYNILWAESTEGDIDWIHGFIEVYNDAIGKRAAYESIVQITDFEASKQMKVLADNVQWFEDNSPIMDAHKKKKVTGVSYKVVQVASESGDASPSTPIGVNLPNNDWIRKEHGSKSVSLGNITAAYEKAGSSGILNEFALNQAEIDRATKHASRAGKLHTALHEVIGHASGQINPGVRPPAETLKQYSSTLEEARADLVALYYIYDQKLVDLGLIESLEVGKAEFDGYLRNGLMTQLQRIELGKNLEEEHMQNRQLVAKWVFEKGKKDNVVEWIKKDGKTYIQINDYAKLKTLFGELLKEIQRIKSEGDFKAGQALVENYGRKVDYELHKEVLQRIKPLNIAPYSGFVNPLLVPVKDKNGNITDIKVENKQNFLEQMLYYGKQYNFLK